MSRSQGSVEPKDTSGIVWEEPPAITRDRGPQEGRWPGRLAPLMEHPGRWAKVWSYQGRSGAGRAVTLLRNGTLHLPTAPEEWEFTSRSDKESGSSYVYARYIGNGTK